VQLTPADLPHLLTSADFVILSSSELFADYFTCRICMQALDGGQQFCCSVCNAMCCFKCLLSYISTNKLDCINRCFNGNQDAVKFCKPHTYIMCMQESAKIKCHECGLILANADAFKKHVCQNSMSAVPNSLAEKLDKIKLAEKRAD
jgi:hypothetical protein